MVPEVAPEAAGEPVLFGQVGHQSTRSLEPTRGGARHRFHRQAAVVNKYGANEVVTCAKTAESCPFFANKLPLLAAAQTHHPPQ